MEPNKAKGNIGTQQSASTSNCPRDPQESFQQKSGTEFVDNVQLHFKNITERMRVIKQSVDGIGENKDSRDSSDQKPVDDVFPESKDGHAAETLSEMDPLQQGQRIKERVERIVKLVRSTAQKAESANAITVTIEKPLNQATVDNKLLVCQNISPVVEEKTLQCNDKNAELAAADGETITGHPVKQVVLKEDEGHEAMKKLPGPSQQDRVSTRSAKEGEELAGERSSERNALVTENDPDCCSFTKRSNEEKKLQAQEPIAESLIDEQIANEKLDGRSNSVAETAALVLAHSNHAGLKTLLSDDNSVRGYVKTQPAVSVQSTNVGDPYRQTAKQVVQDMFARIGCYENFVRQASWANEPSSGPRNLGNISMACSFTDPWEKMNTSTQNSSELATPEETKTDGIASTAQDQILVETKTEETEAEPSIRSIDQSQAASLVTSSEVRSRRRISLKRGQKTWAGLKKKTKSFAVRKTVHKGNTIKKNLTWQILTDESTGYRKVESDIAKDSCQPVEERYQTVNEDKLQLLKEFIMLGGARTKDGEDVVLLNPSKIPSKREFSGRREYNEIMESLLWYVQEFTEEQVKTEKFVVTVHAVKQRRSRLRSLKWATEFYKFLKNRHQNRMTRCVFYKPSFKLRALVILLRPFFSNGMREKIFIVKSHRDFAKAQGLPEDDPVI